MTQTPTVERDSTSPAEPQPAAARSARQSVPAARILVGILALLLLAPTLLSVRGGTDSAENRKPVPFPRLAAGTALDTETYRQFDAALRDRLTLRKQVVKTVGGAGYVGLGASFNSQVYVGQDGIPFFTDDFVKPCRTRYDVAQVDTRIRSWERLARSSGKDVLFAIVPDKSTVLRDKLGGDADALLRCNEPVHKQSQARWGGDVTGPVLALWTPFAEAERAEPGRVFQRGDSHWSYQGSMLFTREVLNRLVARGQAPRQLRDAPGAVQLPDRTMKGDLYRLLGMDRTDQVANWAVRRPGVKVTTSSTPTPTGPGIRIRTATGPRGTAFVPGRTLVVHDSFYYNADMQMAPYFRHLTVIHWDNFIPMARSGDLPAFDRIIFQSAQRGWPQRTVDQLPDPALTATVERELAKPASTRQR